MAKEFEYCPNCGSTDALTSVFLCRDCGCIYCTCCGIMNVMYPHACERDCPKCESSDYAQIGCMIDDTNYD